MVFLVTSAVKKMMALRSRKKVIQGATSSGKTYGIIPILWDKCLETPMLKVTVVAETLPAVKEGCVEIFKNFMVSENRWRDEAWNASELIYTAHNRSKIQFKSFDTVGKAKAAGKRDILFLNEANHIPYPIADALMIRSQEVWMDFNADSEFWAHTEVLQQPNSEFLKLTYLDNEGIPEATLEDLMFKKAKAEAEEASGKRGYWWNWWQVYGLGEIGNLQGAVFNNWTTCDQIPQHAKLLGYGLDYGYQNDQTALVAIYYADGKHYLDELIYETKLRNSDIIARLKQLEVPTHELIVADSAEMKSNDDLRIGGFTVVDARKGADSIVYGVSKMQELDMVVTSRSTNLIFELRNYIWLVDKEGQMMNKPKDKDNHCFSGDTLITTVNGQIPISEIQVGDLVLTSQGYKRVLKKFDNGLKQTYKYSMQFDTFSVSLRSTKEHKIKTEKGWKEVSKLELNEKLYLYKFFKAKNIDFTETSDILVGEQKGCIQKFGSITMETFQKAIMFTMLTVILPITILTTLILFLANYTFVLRVKSDLRTILNGQKNFIQKVLKKLKNGISRKKVANGIKNSVFNHGEIENTERLNVTFAARNIKQGTQESPNIAITTARLLHYEEGEKRSERVYDLMVEDCHEYFANGILVHNCIDAARYYFQTILFH